MSGLSLRCVSLVVGCLFFANLSSAASTVQFQNGKVVVETERSHTKPAVEIEHLEAQRRALEKIDAELRPHFVTDMKHWNDPSFVSLIDELRKANAEQIKRLTQKTGQEIIVSGELVQQHYRAFKKGEFAKYYRTVSKRDR